MFYNQELTPILQFSTNLATPPREERRETGAVWYVYFLQLKNGDIYVGSTNDLRKRLAAHQHGQVNSTKTNLPVDLQSYVAVSTEKIARELESYFKSGSGKAFAGKRFW